MKSNRELSSSCLSYFYKSPKVSDDGTQGTVHYVLQNNALKQVKPATSFLRLVWEKRMTRAAQYRVEPVWAATGGVEVPSRGGVALEPEVEEDAAAKRAKTVAQLEANYDLGANGPIMALCTHLWRPDAKTYSVWVEPDRQVWCTCLDYRNQFVLMRERPQLWG